MTFYCNNSLKEIREEKRGNMTFGEYVKQLMDEKGIWPSELARRTGLHRAYLSRIEVGKTRPPQKQESLNKLASVLQLEGEARERLFELAAHENGIIPEHMQHVRRNAAIPLLMRAINKKQLSEDQVRKLAEMIERDERKANGT